VEQRSAWAVNEDHHIAPVAPAAFRWMDCYVRGGASVPAEPTIELKVVDGKLVAHMTAPEATDVAALVSFGDASSPKRLWLRRWAGKEGDLWRAEIAVPGPEADLWCMAEATYAEDVRLNSRPLFAVPSTLGSITASQAAGRVLYDPDVDGDSVTRSSGTELYSRRYRIGLSDGGPSGGKCLVARPAEETQRSARVMLRHVADPLRAGRDGEALALWVAQKGGGNVIVSATVKRRDRPFSCRVPLLPDGPEWQRLIVKREQLVRKLKDGDEGGSKSLPNWMPLQTLVLTFICSPDAPARIGRFEWVPE